MAKTDTIQMRIEPEFKSDVENILNQLGISTTDAIQMFLRQVVLRGGLPFEVKLPQPNALTAKTIADARDGINLNKFEKAEEMFRELDSD